MTPARREREWRKGDDAVKRQNEERYTEFRLGCDEGDATACNSLGEWWATMRGDYSSAQQIFHTTCNDYQHASACLNYGIMAAAGRGMPKDMAAARHVFGLGCEYGNADACELWGRAQLLGHGGPVDTEAGVASLHKACEHYGHASACNYLGELLLSGRRHVQKDLPGARNALTRACDQSDVAACRNLALMWHRGDGGAADPSQAGKYWDRFHTLLEARTGKKVARQPLPTLASADHASSASARAE